MLNQGRSRSVIQCRTRSVGAGLWRLVAVACAASALSGCGTGYLLQAAHGQWQVQHGREPLATVIARPDTDAALRARLMRVSAAREFASRSLGLPDNRSYRSYRALGRSYVVWNVVATPEFSLQPQHWCFPFTGCLAYRGYFHEDAARNYADTLRRRGYDVMVGGVAAYSTLGHFADPVLDTMMRYGDLQLIGILFHELAHQRVYARSDSLFNESFSTAVERAGLQRWLAAEGRSEELAPYLAREQIDDGLRTVLLGSQQQLRMLYAQPLPPEAMRRQKRVLLDAAGTALRDYERAHAIRSGYDNWVEAGLNNAHLASVGTYFDCVPAFEQLLARSGDDLATFYAAAQSLARGPASARRSFCAAHQPDDFTSR